MVKPRIENHKTLVIHKKAPCGCEELFYQLEVEFDTCESDGEEVVARFCENHAHRLKEMDEKIAALRQIVRQRNELEDQIKRSMKYV